MEALARQEEEQQEDEEVEQKAAGGVSSMLRLYTHLYELFGDALAARLPKLDIPAACRPPRAPTLVRLYDDPEPDPEPGNTHCQG